MSYADFVSSNDAIDWDTYFKAMGLENIPELDAKQAEYYKKLAKVLRDISVDDQKYYLAFNLLDMAAPYLSDDFANANFDFYGKVMSGKQEMKPRWKRALQTVNSSLGEAVGQMYVEKYFPASSKEKMLTLVGNLQKHFQSVSIAWNGWATRPNSKHKKNSLPSRSKSVIQTSGVTTVHWISRTTLIGPTSAARLSSKWIICWPMQVNR